MTNRGSSAVETQTATAGLQTTTTSTAELNDEELASVLAVVVPAAIAADPDGSGRVVATTTYVVADSLGRADGNAVVFSGQTVLLSDSARAAVHAALSPADVSFAPADLTKWMLLIAQPVLEDGAVAVSYEQRCGGDGNALCGSGGAFRLEKVIGKWTITEVLSAWIS